MELSSLLILLPALIGFWILISREKPQQSLAKKGPPKNAIVVDGSNVLHWGGEPSIKVLNRVLQDISGRGYHPIVFFDANVGYVIGDRYFDEARLSHITGIPQAQICVVSKGVVADQSILMFASDHGLRVVTNDRYRDWRVAFPHAAKKGTLLGGAWQEGAVKWRGQL